MIQLATLRKHVGRPLAIVKSLESMQVQPCSAIRPGRIWAWEVALIVTCWTAAWLEGAAVYFRFRWWGQQAQRLGIRPISFFRSDWEDCSECSCHLRIALRPHSFHHIWVSWISPSHCSHSSLSSQISANVSLLAWIGYPTKAQQEDCSKLSKLQHATVWTQGPASPPPTPGSLLWGAPLRQLHSPVQRCVGKFSLSPVPLCLNPFSDVPLCT